MSLEMRKSSQWWYGRFMVNGKLRCVNLKVKVLGVRPADGMKEGDRTFERSRDKALAAFENLTSEVAGNRRAAEYVQQLHRIRTGRKIVSIPLENLAEEWVNLPRKRSVEDNYLATAKARIGRFLAFMREKYPTVVTMSEVTSAMALEFLRKEELNGFSGRTVNGALVVLKSAFRKLAAKADMAVNPFDGIPMKDVDMVHRKPFSQVELKAILDAAADDDFVRPIVIASVSTAMRLGDCCTLRWTDVDLKSDFVRVKTAKTGETAEIPMFALLRQEIEKHLGNRSEFVFPEQAAMYQRNNTGVTYRVRKMFERAGFYDVDAEAQNQKEPAAVDERPLLPVAELQERVLTVLNALPAGVIEADKRARMIEAFGLYVNGATVSAVARQMEISKSSVSVYLSEIEERTGLRVKRDEAAALVQVRAKQLGEVTTARGAGQRRVSVRDFHSFRVTWITLALAAGVPMELVTRVTGHHTVDVVLKHYFRPGREDFRKAIEKAMPGMLVSAPARLLAGDVEYAEAPGPSELLCAALGKLAALTPKNFRLNASEAVALVRQAKEWIDGRVLREMR